MAGTVRDVTEQKHVELRARYNADGVSISVLGTLADISHQKRLASKTGTFLRNARADVFQGDLRLDQLFGTPTGEKIASLQQFLVRLHADDRPRVLAAFELCRTRGNGFEQEFRVVCPAGSERWVYGRAQTWRDHQGRPDWITGACVDTTALRSMERQLRLTQQRFSVALEAASDIFWANDASGRMTGEAELGVLHWASREPGNAALAHKPVALMGAAGGMGSSRAQYHLRQVLVRLDLVALNGPEVFANAFAGSFDADGRLVDPAVGEGIRHQMLALKNLAQLLRRP